MAPKRQKNGSVKKENTSVEADKAVKAENGNPKATKIAKKRPTKSPKTEKVANPNARVTRSASQD